MFNNLPGFYFDPIKGKYYRIPTGDPENSTIKKLKADYAISRASEEEKAYKHENIAITMRSRELGHISGVHAPVKYLKLKTANKTLLQDLSLNDNRPYEIKSVEFIKGGKNSIFGIWQTDKETQIRYVVGEVNFVNCPDRPIISFKAFNKHVIDMCEGPGHSIMCVFNSFSMPYKEGFGTFAYFMRPDHGMRYFLNSGDPDPIAPIFCIKSFRNMERFAFGSQSYIKFYHDRNYYDRLRVHGRVHSISFQDNSEVMAYGDHFGYLRVYDINSKEAVGSIKVCDRALTDLTFVDSHQIIVASLKNKLRMYDLRNRQLVTQYFEHVQTMQKVPFSIANNLLCARGKDNLICIWPISGGNPIHKIRPNICGSVSRGWLNADANKTYLNYFEDDHKKVFQIT